MARILFGGPQEKERGEPSDVHDDLIARLRNKGHEVDHIVRGDQMIGGLTYNRNFSPSNPFQLVIYDTGLYWDQAALPRRAELFADPVVEYLKKPGIPVLVLAEKEMAELTRDFSERAGFTQIDQPYETDEVCSVVERLLDSTDR